MTQFEEEFRRRMGAQMKGLCEGAGTETQYDPAVVRKVCPECGRVAPVRTQGSVTYFLSHQATAR